MTDVPYTREQDLWLAELSYLSASQDRLRSTQFAIRTAVKAQQLAALAGTDAVDELLDARDEVTADSSKRVFEQAVYYVRTDRSLTRDMSRLGLQENFGF